MTALTDANFIELKTELDIAEVWNEVRVLIPSYSYSYKLVDGVWIRMADDYTQRYTDGDSINKYGRRTKTFNKHVMDSSFGESYCTGEIEKGKTPANKLELRMVGKDDANTVLALATKISDQISYVNAISGLSGTGLVDSVVLDIDLDFIPRMVIGMTEVTAAWLLDWFIIDTDLIDGAHVIG